MSDPLLSVLHVSLMCMADRVAQLETRAYGAKASELGPISVPPLPPQRTVPSPDYPPTHDAVFVELPWLGGKGGSRYADVMARPCSCEESEGLRARLKRTKAAIDAVCRKGTDGGFADSEAELVALYEALRVALP
jgi:hypothetical protein